MNMNSSMDGGMDGGMDGEKEETLILIRSYKQISDNLFWDTA